MAEEAEDAGPSVDTGGLAADLAMEEARSDPSLHPHVAAFLKDQRRLIADQRHHLHLGLWEKRLGVLLRVATAFIGIAVAASLGFLIWNAVDSNDLVIDAFQVPPDLAVHGLSGQVVAAKLADRIAAMQAESYSSRAPKSYTNGTTDGLKLEIPETGVSLSELDRFLREKLGHDLHIGGEVVQTEKELALTVRLGAKGSATVTGAQSDIDSMLQKLAEQVYRLTQPYLYGAWLVGHDRRAEARAVTEQLASNGPPKERAWSYLALSLHVAEDQSDQAGTALLRRGSALDPENYVTPQYIALDGDRMGRAEQSLRDWQAALSLLSAHGTNYSLPAQLAFVTHAYRTNILQHQGDLLEAVNETSLYRDSGFVPGTSGRAMLYAARVEILAALHDPAAAHDALAEIPATIPMSGSTPLTLLQNLRARMPLALEEHDWSAVLAVERDIPALMAKYPGLKEVTRTFFDPPAALALGHLGRFPEAEARLKPMPGDCYPCLRARAQVAEMQGQHDRADWWFARAAAVGPSLPYAEAEWGCALLDRGKPDDAIEQFAASNKKAPHFADPLEGWGEALAAKNQSHLALAKFAEAEKYAPNWGRLHLKWGEALVYAGKREEAAKQFARAAQLDLTPSEKTELARMH